MSFIRTAPIGIASTPPVASASPVNIAACPSCCGMNCDGLLSVPRPVNTHSNISARYASPRRNNLPVAAGCACDSSVAHTPIVSAQRSMRAMARRRSPRLRARTMKGWQAAVLRMGTRTGLLRNQLTTYERTVAATMAIAINLDTTVDTEDAEVQSRFSHGSIRIVLRVRRVRRGGEFVSQRDTVSAPKCSSYRVLNSSHVYAWLKP